MSRLLIILAASFIGASGSIVTSGKVMNSMAFALSGATFLARTLTTRSRSVIIPIGLPALFVTMTQPTLLSSMSLATWFADASSSVVTTGLVMTSLTSILVLIPISDIMQPRTIALFEGTVFTVTSNNRTFKSC